jgi:hypothetical protein
MYGTCEASPSGIPSLSQARPRAPQLDAVSDLSRFDRLDPPQVEVVIDGDDSEAAVAVSDNSRPGRQSLRVVAKVPDDGH